MPNHNQWLFRQQLSVVSLTKILLDPFVAVLVLIGCALYFDEPFKGPYPILALIVFTLTFPGKWPEVTLRAFWNESVMPWFFLSGLILLFGYSTGYLDFFPPNLVMAWMLVTPVAMYVAHRITRKLLPRLLLLEGGRRRAIIVGAGSLGTELRGRFVDDSSLGVDVIGFFDDRSLDRTDLTDPKKLLGKLTDIPEYVNRNSIDLVYITLPMAAQPRTLGLLDALRDTTTSVYFVPDIFVSDLIQARVDHIHGMPVVALTETPTLGVSGIGKRLSDLVIASLILLMIWPLLLILALGVKLSSPGPIIFKQCRYGLDGHEILIYKFRSMRAHAESGVIQQAGREDPRITPFGRFIRRTSLDELPQFINVLQGRMSVVGPRPHAVSHNEQYRKLIKGYMLRHKVKPGITGWAQVNGLRGETETLDKMRARVQYDIDYMRNWSLMFDLMIIGKTLAVVWRDQNAY
ncbi:MAG TPA: undecaprenyl-phosphate glucose phosphotransferase [Thiobacillus sp.]|nr:MAG: undecaprenyl-phosphate glucose phosphotransferase [Hydrogenophilales bacterium 28-61-11]OYZ58852.1 MAG: undecaprenyl-phosphate glucose phosphotransferase [Hydrogenophilales bacterium 16-61-112]OZA47852.1 MAG: undecaprenyl-phosphate glucose phosphotransferase [Hydrogenophilales bacterium 17-61-76]HQT30183.1 undecaprenyl-phosphate glucose phosphotransferase [Thiobacillus sp.]HQT69246.1 undecaprenyl-phosphate glucose phosphotransferase [Thiobacillus sp.]